MSPEPRDVWLPIGYAIRRDSKIKRLLDSGKDWQIFDTCGPNKVLVVRAALAEKWCTCGLVDISWLVDINFGQYVYRALITGKEFALKTISSCKLPTSRDEALTFAVALRESRKCSSKTSFHDAIYVEQFSRLLPTWQDEAIEDDETVLGTWLTGGVVLSTNSFQRLTSLSGWLSSDDLKEVVQAAGLRVPASGEILTKCKSMRASDASQNESLSLRETAQQPEEKVEQFFLPGRPKLEAFFNEHVVDIVRNRERYAALGIEFPSAIILYGPPGCGKSYAVERLAEFLGWPCWSIDSGSVGSPYIHETSKKISEVFDKAIESAPSILIIDEMESFLTDRQSEKSSGGHHVEEVAEFLRRIPEATKKNVLIVAMTNLIDMIDPAILRRGRFDYVIEVSMPSREEVMSLLSSLLEKLPKTPELDLTELIDFCTGKPLSDTAFFVREMARLTARYGKSEIDQESIDTVLASLPENQREKSAKKIGFV